MFQALFTRLVNQIVREILQKVKYHPSQTRNLTNEQAELSKNESFAQVTEPYRSRTVNLRVNDSFRNVQIILNAKNKTNYEVVRE